MKEGGTADGQKNRQVNKSGTSTYTTCLRDWNSHSSSKDGNREYLIKTKGRETSPQQKYNIVCL